jgi:hypothetical protein
VPSVPDAFAASSSGEVLAPPLQIAWLPLPSQRAEAGFHKYRGVRCSLCCLAIGTAVARPAADGLHPVQFRPICLCHPIGDARSSFSAPFHLSLSQVGRHRGRRSKISRSGRCVTSYLHLPRRRGAQYPWKNRPSWWPCSGSSVASRSRMICFGARRCASRNMSIGSASIAAAW